VVIVPPLRQLQDASQERCLPSSRPYHRSTLRAARPSCCAELASNEGVVERTEGFRICLSQVHPGTRIVGASENMSAGPTHRSLPRASSRLPVLWCSAYLPSSGERSQSERQNARGSGRARRHNRPAPRPHHTAHRQDISETMAAQVDTGDSHQDGPEHRR